MTKRRASLKSQFTKRTYMGVNINHAPTGWWSALITEPGREQWLRADTLAGIKALVKRELTK